ncbi:Transmembrane and coiled-coil domains protein 3-like isoform X2 [Oopsacas minuta]|uniref:Transmembrane and coiled-coil domains protein 3-like isoform X2 n=1 Tax=Oopsacas minuta TaxID=111878 RepID=A0AAV7JPS9_9METZ|nr:Transmembrane and coiled-coil domains protein 3-like isoform X2 [Oopsacas minuta]
MTEYSPPSSFPPNTPPDENRFSRTLSLEATLRHQTNTKPKHERIKRFPHRKSKTDSKKKYFTDDMRLNASSYSESSYHLPSRAASHTDTHSSANNSFYNTRDHPIVYCTPHSPEDQLPISDDNLSNITQHQTSETDFPTNTKFTDLLLKPKNVLKESHAYRHLTSMMRPRSGNIRGGLLTNSDSERGCETNSFVPSDTNSEDDMSHFRFMQNRNVHNIAYHSQDKEKLLDLIRSELEIVKGEFREVKTGHSQLRKSVEDVEGKLNDSQYRISSIELMLTDFTEMHQNEVQELKQQLAQIQYDSVGRVQDLEEGQDILQRKIIELEVRTNMQESASQLFAPNGGGFFRSLLFKVLNVVILIISIIAMTTVKVFSQFRYKRLRSTLSFVIIIIIVYISYSIYYNGWEYIDWRLFFGRFW